MASSKTIPTSPTNTQADGTMPKKQQRKSRAGVRSGASEDCSKCSQSGSKCDRQRPYCGRCVDMYGKCPGYHINLTWDVGVASRGKMKGQLLPIPMAKPPASAAADAPSADPASRSSPSDVLPLHPSTTYQNKQQQHEQQQHQRSHHSQQQHIPQLVTRVSDSSWEDLSQAHVSPTHASPTHMSSTHSPTIVSPPRVSSHDELATTLDTYHPRQREHLYNSVHRIRKRRTSPPRPTRSCSLNIPDTQPLQPSMSSPTSMLHVGMDQMGLMGHWHVDSYGDAYRQSPPHPHEPQNQQHHETYPDLQLQQQPQLQQHLPQEHLQQQHLQQQHLQQQHIQFQQQQQHLQQHLTTPYGLGQFDESLSSENTFVPKCHDDGIIPDSAYMHQPQILAASAPSGVKYMGSSWDYSDSASAPPTHSPDYMDVSILDMGMAVGCSAGASMAALAMSSAPTIDMVVPATTMEDIGVSMGMGMDQTQPLSYPATYAPVMHNVAYEGLVYDGINQW